MYERSMSIDTLDASWTQIIVECKFSILSIKEKVGYIVLFIGTIFNVKIHWPQDPKVHRCMITQGLEHQLLQSLLLQTHLAYQLYYK